MGYSKMTAQSLQIPENQLHSISSARLPQTYETAKNALAECSRIDECQAWADKAEAMASYAKQAKDESLRKMADRIQARAIRRCGELLKQIEPGTGKYQSKSKGDLTLVDRKQAAQNAGMSLHQQRTAIRVASVPEPQFIAAVESENPPTVSKLAEIGTQKREPPPAPRPLVDLKGIPPEHYARATEAQGTLRRFTEFCEKHDPLVIAKAYHPHEIAALRRYVASIDSWLDRFVTNLPEV